MRLILASSNRGKLVEMRELLSGLEVELIPQADLGIGDADEIASTFVENALLKARHAARASGLAALGDDSGICVDELGGAPGLYSARYAGAHGDAQANIAKLLHELRDVPDARRAAHFYCVIVMLRSADDPMPLIAEGRWDGSILEAPRGNGGFGYDPLFLIPEYHRTFGELSSRVKHALSHRGRAVAKLRPTLREIFR